MKILYVSLKEDIELSYPDGLNFIMKWIWKYLKVKTVKRNRGKGQHFTNITFDEYAYIPKKQVSKLINSNKK